NYNTGIANTGDVDTGAFITGNYSNGLFLSGDYQGLVGLNLVIDMPLPISLGVNIPIDIPITASAGNITLMGVTIPPTGDIVLSSIAGQRAHFGPITIPNITVVGPTTTVAIGGPNTAITITGGGAIRIPLISIPAAPGFGNSTTNPSSGFFNTGAGGASGFGN
ncbi:hypothetical protein FVP32_24985, partial [Mycobacterium tuberculosis]|nr:hypothetical protein [Mycobacterium tuberculosis]